MHDSIHLSQLADHMMGPAATSFPNIVDRIPSSCEPKHILHVVGWFSSAVSNVKRTTTAILLVASPVICSLDALTLPLISAKLLLPNTLTTSKLPHFKATFKKGGTTCW